MNIVHHAAHTGQPHETGRERKRTAAETGKMRKEGTVAAGTEAASEAIARGTVLATGGTETGIGIADVTEILTEVIAAPRAIETGNVMKGTGTAAANGLKMTTSPTEEPMTVQKGSARTMSKTHLPHPMGHPRHLLPRTVPGVLTAKVVTETPAMALMIHLDFVKGEIGGAATTTTGVVELGALYLPESMCVQIPLQFSTLSHLSNRRDSPMYEAPAEDYNPEDPKEDDSEARSVFVSQLAARLTARDLGYFFEDKLGEGTVMDARIVTDRLSRRSKG